MSSADPPKTNHTSLLEKTQALMEVERSLTATLEQVHPWLPKNTRNPASWRAYSKRVRPIPNNMEEVNQVLALARTYASRTSAPAGWNPAAPVVGFSTPNPLPHQLRGGALAALELERARQEERSQKRKRQEEEEEQAKAKKQAAEEENKAKGEEGKVEGGSPQRPVSAKQILGDGNQGSRRVPAARPAPQVTQTSMNLSDSSSEEESDDE